MPKVSEIIPVSAALLPASCVGGGRLSVHFGQKLLDEGSLVVISLRRARSELETTPETTGLLATVLRLAESPIARNPLINIGFSS